MTTGSVMKGRKLSGWIDRMWTGTGDVEVNHVGAQTRVDGVNRLAQAAVCCVACAVINVIVRVDDEGGLG